MHGHSVLAFETGGLLQICSREVGERSTSSHIQVVIPSCVGSVVCRMFPEENGNYVGSRDANDCQ